MRGNRVGPQVVVQCHGSIPAHAGKPFMPLILPGVLWVYPRACGETAIDDLIQAWEKGLSPRMRGNQPSDDTWGAAKRSIPAHAGKPAAPRRSQRRFEVYPRACGETRAPGTYSIARQGLSPRMRGNLLERHLPGPSPGSIPAHAGKPSPSSGAKSPARVYPRACGETRSRHSSQSGQWGLSPRMRGNL